MKKKDNLPNHPLCAPLLKGDIQALSKAISLMESQLKKHHEEAAGLLAALKTWQPTKKQSIRVAISGVPGVGKSTFIEALGSYLIQKNRKVAVLTIDPSSQQSGGSILGDKTRMPLLSQSPLAYIRTTPAAATLGGVASNTRASIQLCEAAGFEVILIETVGVGQNELSVHELVDFFLLLKLPGAGDEIQGIKRGIMEVADALLINKADGAGAPLAKKAQQFFQAALHAFPQKENGWNPPVLLASAIENTGITEVWSQIEAYVALQKKNGQFLIQRQQQEILGWQGQLNEMLLQEFNQDPSIQSLIKRLALGIKKGEHTAASASKEAIKAFRKQA